MAAVNNGVTNCELISNEENDEKKLLKPPVPELDVTLKKYLGYVKVIADENDYRQTEHYVERFLNQDGPVLQKRLLQIADEDDNWINRFWLTDMYLNNRVALPINSNPGYVLPDRKFQSVEDMVKYSACFICGLYDYKTMIDNRSLTIDTATGKIGGQPLCMEQYWRLFTSYRFPAIPLDRQNTRTNAHMKNNEHIIAICNNHTYVVYTVVDGERLNQQKIANQLQQVWKRSETRCTENVNVLTAIHRDNAAERIKIVLKDSLNRDFVNLIETSSFIFCMDKAINDADLDSLDNVEGHLAKRAMEMLHGCGTEKFTCNRWFDKTMQFIVSENGACGMNYEHSVAEGIVVICLVEHALKYVEEHLNKKSIGTTDEVPEVKELTWNIPNELKPLIKDSKDEINKLIQNMDFCVLYFDAYGREYPKSKKMSPDAFIQMILQWTYFRCHGKLVPTYESASIRRFRSGRVDNIRSATPEALEWVRTMEDLSASDNVTGYGIDNHLTALRELSKHSGQPYPEIFSDPMFQQSFQFQLSTSQVPTSVPKTFLCYGAVVEDGYGCGYNPSANEILFTVASFKSCQKTNSAVFRETLKTTLNDMKEFLDS